MEFEIDGSTWFLIGLIVLTLIAAGMVIGQEICEKSIILSQETADKICLGLTGTGGVIALDYNMGRNADLIEKGELYCKMPSYDETQLIKVGK